MIWALVIMMISGGCANLPSEPLVHKEQTMTFQSYLEETVNAAMPGGNSSGAEQPDEIVNSNSTDLTPTAVNLPTVVVYGENSVPTPTLNLASIPTLSNTAVSSVVSSGTGSDSTGSTAEVVMSPTYGTNFSPSQAFTWTVTLRNIGSKTWSTIYYIQRYDGTVFTTDDTRKSLPKEVVPGDSITFTYYAYVPSQDGDYTSKWYLGDEGGNVVKYFNYEFTVGPVSAVTSITTLTPTITPTNDESVQTSTPNGYEWMCTDIERSKIMGSGCADYCQLYYQNVNPNGACFSEGNLISAK